MFQTINSYIKQLKIRFLNDQDLGSHFRKKFPNNDTSVKFPNDFDLGKYLRK
jgi:hypothetical protein